MSKIAKRFMYPYIHICTRQQLTGTSRQAWRSSRCSSTCVLTGLAVAWLVCWKKPALRSASSRSARHWKFSSWISLWVYAAHFCLDGTTTGLHALELLLDATRRLGLLDRRAQEALHVGDELPDYASVLSKKFTQPGDRHLSGARQASRLSAQPVQSRVSTSLPRSVAAASYLAWRRLSIQQLH